MNTQEMVTGGQETASLIENSRQPEETLYVDTKLGRTPNAKVLTVPFRTQVWTTKVAPDGTNEVRPTYPNFIKCLEDGRIDDALVSLSIEIRTRLIMALSFKHISLEAPLGVRLIESTETLSALSSTKLKLKRWHVMQMEIVHH